MKVQLNVNGPAGGGDGQPDQILVNGTNADDAIRLAAAGNTILVDGLFPLVRITSSDGVNDHLTVNALGGNDTVDANNLPANLIGLTLNLGDGQIAPTVTGVVVNGGAADRSQVAELRIAFDRHVILSANPTDAFRLIRQSDGAAVTLQVAVDDTGAGTVVSFRFVGGAVEGASLADGRYTLTVLSAQVASQNGALDGNSDGQPGGDFVLAGDTTTNRLFRLFGDVNGDAAVNGLDLAAFRAAFGSAAGSPAYLNFLDINGDGAINGLDLAAFRTRFGTNLP